MLPDVLDDSLTSVWFPLQGTMERTWMISPQGAIKGELHNKFMTRGSHYSTYVERGSPLPRRQIHARPTFIRSKVAAELRLKKIPLTPNLAI